MAALYKRLCATALAVVPLIGCAPTTKGFYPPGTWPSPTTAELVRTGAVNTQDLCAKYLEDVIAKDSSNQEAILRQLEYHNVSAWSCVDGADATTSAAYFARVNGKHAEEQRKIHDDDEQLCQRYRDDLAAFPSPKRTQIRSEMERRGITEYGCTSAAGPTRVRVAASAPRYVDEVAATAATSSNFSNATSLTTSEVVGGIAQLLGAFASGVSQAASSQNYQMVPTPSRQVFSAPPTGNRAIHVNTPSGMRHCVQASTGIVNCF